MKNILTGMVVIVAQVLSVGTASAVPIYDESVNGDLDAIGSTNVNLVAGVNTINGTINATPPAETDRIKFTQTPGLTIDSIVLSFGGWYGNIGMNMSTALFNNVANLFDDNFSTIDDTNWAAGITASFYDSFGPETGPLSTTTDGAIWDFQLSAGLVYPATSWTLTINTSSSSVPEPSIFALLGLGLVAIGLNRRRKV